MAKAVVIFMLVLLFLVRVSVPLKLPAGVVLTTRLYPVMTSMGARVLSPVAV